MRSLRIFMGWLFLTLALVPVWKIWDYWKQWELGGVQGGGFNPLMSMIAMLLMIIAVCEVGCRVDDLLYTIGDTEED